MNTTWLEKSEVGVSLSQKQHNIKTAPGAEGPQLPADQAALSTRPCLAGAQEAAVLGQVDSGVLPFPKQARLPHSAVHLVQRQIPSLVFGISPCSVSLSVSDRWARVSGGRATGRSTEAHCRWPRGRAPQTWLL